MRRVALLGLLLLPGCQFVANPTDGFGHFIADTHTWHLNANRPPIEGEQAQDIVGVAMAVPPLTPESGEVWPGPPAAIPTLQDVQKLNNLEMLPDPTIPNTPPPAVFPQNQPK